MTALTMPFFWTQPKASADEPVLTDPPTPPKWQPVFIYDAVTPWRGETLLAAYLKADIDRALRDQDE